MSPCDETAPVCKLPSIETCGKGSVAFLVDELQLAPLCPIQPTSAGAGKRSRTDSDEDSDGSSSAPKKQLSPSCESSCTAAQEKEHAVPSPKDYNISHADMARLAMWHVLRTKVEFEGERIFVKGAGLEVKLALVAVYCAERRRYAYAPNLHKIENERLKVKEVLDGLTNDKGKLPSDFSAEHQRCWRCVNYSMSHAGLVKLSQDGSYASLTYQATNILEFSDWELDASKFYANGAGGLQGCVFKQPMLCFNKRRRYADASPRLAM